MKKMKIIILIVIFSGCIIQFNVIHAQNLFPDTGFVGIGVLNPQYNLDVNGNVRISNNLYVGGGIIITEKVNATTSVITATLKSASLQADSILMDSTKAFYGESKFVNDVKLQSKLDVYGNATVFGDLKTNGSLFFGGNKAISYLPASAGNSEIFGFGNPANPLLLPKNINCNVSQPEPTSYLQLHGMYNSWGYANNNPSMLNVMQMGFDGSNGIIDIAGSNPISSNAPRLLINYWCGKDIFMNTGDNGGNVIMSRLGKVGIGTEILDKKLNVNGDAYFVSDFALNRVEILGHNGIPVRRGISIDDDPLGYFNFFINANQTNAAFRFMDGNSTTVALMKIQKNGNVGIGTNQADYKLDVAGTIRGCEVIVTTHWCDYVFEKDYNLMPICELEKYLLEHKHLPSIKPGSEIEANGLELAKMNQQMMEKIEELTLYIIQLNKRIDELENNIVK